MASSQAKLATQLGLWRLKTQHQYSAFLGKQSPCGNSHCTSLLSMPAICHVAGSLSAEAILRPRRRLLLCAGTLLRDA